MPSSVNGNFESEARATPMDNSLESFSISNFTINQAVALENTDSIPLIENKGAILRVYFNIPYAYHFNNAISTVKLSSVSNPSLLPLKFTGTILHTPYPIAERSTLVLSFDLRENKELWFAQGNNKYKIEVNQGNAIDPDHPTYRKLEKEFKVISPPAIKIKLINIRGHRDSDFLNTTQLEKTRTALLSFLSSRYPVVDIQIDSEMASYNFTKRIKTREEVSSVVASINSMRISEEQRCSDIYLCWFN